MNKRYTCKDMENVKKRLQKIKENVPNCTKKEEKITKNEENASKTNKIESLKCNNKIIDDYIYGSKYILKLICDRLSELSSIDVYKTLYKYYPDKIEPNELDFVIIEDNTVYIKVKYNKETFSYKEAKNFEKYNKEVEYKFELASISSKEEFEKYIFKELQKDLFSQMRRLMKREEMLQDGYIYSYDILSGYEKIDKDKVIPNRKIKTKEDYIELYEYKLRLIYYHVYKSQLDLDIFDVNKDNEFIYHYGEYY